MFYQLYVFMVESLRALLSAVFRSAPPYSHTGKTHLHLEVADYNYML